MLCISTSKHVLCMLFPGQNQFFYAKTTFYVLLSHKMYKIMQKNNKNHVLKLHSSTLLRVRTLYLCLVNGIQPWEWYQTDHSLKRNLIGSSGIQTHDLPIMRQTCYHLSYRASGHTLCYNMLNLVYFLGLVSFKAAHCWLNELPLVGTTWEI